MANWKDFFSKFSAKELLSGELLTSEQVKRNYGLIVLILVLMLVYINSGFRAQQQQREMRQLQKELTDAHYELLDLSSEYTQMTRPSALSRQLEAQGSPVREATRPPIEIR